MANILILILRGKINLDAEEIKASKIIQEDAEMIEVRRRSIMNHV